jgi:probable DNA metabolism protein
MPFLNRSISNHVLHWMRMRVYLFDGTMDGLLTALASLREVRSEQDQLVAETDWQPDLFSETQKIATDPKCASEYLESLSERIGRRNVRTLMYAWLTEETGMALHILRYCALGWKHGRGIHGFHANDSVRAVNQAARRVGGEIHRMKGLLRFRQISPDGLLWGPMEPEFDVALSLSFHFQVRLRAERWIIHDVRRGFGVAWDGQCVRSVTEEEIRLLGGDAQRPALTAEEQAVQQMWRSYFRSVSIKNRRNTRLQRSNMPRRYWPYLIEMEGRVN